MTKPLALTMGEPSGIGPDLAISAWLNRQELNLPAFAVFGCAETLTARALTLGIHNLPLRTASADQLPHTSGNDSLLVVNSAAVEPNCCGQLNSANGHAVVESIQNAVSAVFNGFCSAVVTNPIHKKNLYDTGFAYPGHTEFLGALAQQHTGQPVTPVMLIASDILSTVPVTIHIPLEDVSKTLTSELISETIRICNADFIKRFGISAPRIAVAGLNPHAGEDGSMGLEDRDVIAPTLAELKADGINVFGPLPADTMFHPRARARYDVAVCMYHDQALIPAKTLAFDEGVNVTLGLPFVRTSPDHGTALDIAGKGVARSDSLVSAIKLAEKMAAGGTI
ncbi:MAG: 4-hydroxythreonine-4-phosphate dehydrogenase PdxA [Hyphomicrobiales bacterium]